MPAFSVVQQSQCYDYGLFQYFSVTRGLVMRTQSVRVLANLVAGALALVAMGQAPTQAATLNIDFGPPGNVYNSVGAAPDSGTFWNGVGFNGATNLTYSDGALSTIAVTTNFKDEFSNVNSGGSPSSNALVGDRITDVNSGNVGGTFSVTLSNLQAGTYDLYAYAGYYGQDFQVGSTTGYASGQDFANPAAFVPGVHYALLSNLTVDITGVLVLLITGADPPFPNDIKHTTIAGLQLQQVPIPPALMLFVSGLGALGLFGRRKKRNVFSTPAAA